MKKILSFISLLISAGCWTTASFATAISSSEAPQIFGGVRLWHSCLESPRTEVIAFFGLLDLPISFAVDFSLLPLTLIFALVERAIETI